MIYTKKLYGINEFNNNINNKTYYVYIINDLNSEEFMISKFNILSTF